MKCTVLLLVIILKITYVDAQTVNQALLNKAWRAQWITGPGEPINIWSGIIPAELKSYGVYKFRKTFNLATVPSTFVINVSADNRYKLYVNEHLIALGPARGDLYYWNFETVDIARYLQQGKNVVAAVVWNDGSLKPEAQVSHMTAFIVQGNTETEEIINTNDSWKSVKDEGYQPLHVNVSGYYVAGPGELIDMNNSISNWEKETFDDTHWKQARVLFPGMPKGVFSFLPAAWMLTPSPIPLMELTVQRLKKVRRSEGIQLPATFPEQKKPVTIPANTKAVILFDQEFLTNAYPTLLYSKGKNARLSLAYAEALYEKNAEGKPGNLKGNRNEVEGKTFRGKLDSLIADGSSQQKFTSLWWRTYRYIRLVVETKGEPLILEDIYGTFTGYPFQLKAKFISDHPLLEKNFKIGFRTARLCAFETYMDCPYYEQLQYIGDTRIQALVTLYNTGDATLVKNAIALSNHSRIAEGVTMSRYPTSSPQIIPGFSLWWIAMVHDYWRYVPDETFVKQQLPGTREVLSFFNRYQQEDGSLKHVPYWTFSDWVNGFGWKDGVAPVENGESAVLDLHLLWTYQTAAALERSLGLKELADRYEQRAEVLKKTIQQKYWDASRKLYADTPSKEFYSQHANALALLTETIQGEEAQALGRKLLNDTALAPASIYFKFYLHQAMVKCGMGNDYLTWLDKWNENISLGLTTWAETSDVSAARSDCHAWGASPNVEFFRTVLGIDSDAPGFSKVKVEPHPGALKKLSGEMPHPAGSIKVSYTLIKGKWRIEIEIPPTITGRFVWKQQSYELRGGKNSFEI